MEEQDFIPYKTTNDWQKGNVLVFAPHPDDEVFGCGGAILKHLAQGDQVEVIIITDGASPVIESQKSSLYKSIRQQESINAACVLGYGEPIFLDYPDRGFLFNESSILHILQLLETHHPAIIYLPSSSEIHPDHISVFQVLVESVKRCSHQIELYFYEIGQMQKANRLLDISGFYAQLNQAMDCFKSQLEAQDYKYHINALHAYRTYTLGKNIKYAEAYFYLPSTDLFSGSEVWQKTNQKKGPINIDSNLPNDNNPLISIVVRTMNRRDLAQALKSISEQSYSNIEVLVIDALGKNSIVLGDSCGNFPLRVISENRPLSRPQAANVGLKHVNGTYFCFLDEDDLLYSFHCGALINVLQGSNSVAAYSNIERVDANHDVLNVYNDDFDFIKLLWGNYIPLNAIMFSNSVLKECEFDEDFELYEDWNFIIQVSMLGSIIHMNKLTGKYIDTNSSGVRSNAKKIHEMDISLKNKWKNKISPEMYFEFLNYGSQLLKDDNIRFKKKNEKLNLSINKYLKQIEILESKNQDNRAIINSTEESVVELERVIQDKESQVQNLHSEKLNLEINAKMIKNSISWRITKVFRLPIFEAITNIILKYRFDKLLKNTELFDANYYLSNNEDVEVSGVSPIKHFLFHGGIEGRNPSEIFNSKLYLEQNPDVKEAGINPLYHYLLFGKKETRKCVNIDVEGNELTNTEYQRILERQTDTPNVITEMSDNDTLKLIKESDLFNAEYYIHKNKDVKEAGIEPHEHYLYWGYKEKRNPSKDFDNQFYLETNPDVVSFGINPLLHYLKYGINENRLPKAIKVDENHSLSLADINNVEIDDDSWTEQKVAIVCHLYYFDLADEIIEYLKNIPISFDIFISTRANYIEKVNVLFSSKFKGSQVLVKSFSNKGRDIFPFVSYYKSHLQNYDLVCKIHSKKSPHNLHLEGWRKYLLEQLIGGKAPIKKILHSFKSDKKLGVVWPIEYPYLSVVYKDNDWINDDASAKFYQSHSKLPKIRSTRSDFNFEFPTGSMFWFRPQSFKELLQLNIQMEDFEEEKNQLDYTLAHYLERLWPQFVKDSSFSIQKSYFSDKMRIDQSEHRKKLPTGPSILFITHDLFQAGAQQILLNILNWLYHNTSIKMSVVALKLGDDGGKLKFAIESVADLYMWDQLENEYGEEAIHQLENKVGTVDLIYGNTIVSTQIYSFLSAFNAPFITHIHELEKSIQKYTLDKTREVWKNKTNLHIACSEPVEINLQENHNIKPTDILCIHEFIKPHYIVEPNKLDRREMLALPEHKTIIWACGTINWRKGTDVFIKVAHELKKRGVENFEFNWIGDNYWNIEHADWGDWTEWEEYIKKYKLEKLINIIPSRNNPSEYFAAGDLFFLPSREDPFPLVCLEAAECGLPIVCFEKAGGIPTLVGDDAGFSVPFLDVEKAADVISKLISDEKLKQKLGAKAREKVFSSYTTDIAVPQILKACHKEMKTQPLVSVVVPVFNHGDFVVERIESILNQTFKDFEIIILDDCSTDNSLSLIRKYETNSSIRIITNEVNTGSPFKQWGKGVEQAQGKYIWIAEGDDVATPEFIESLLVAFSNPNVRMAYSASHQVDQIGEVEKEHYINIGHYSNLGFPKERWQKEYYEEGKNEIESALAIRNTIPNVSAVIFEAQAIKSVDFEKAAEFKNGGDWYSYLSILKTGEIYYHPAHLNYHRVHSTSVVVTNKILAKNTLPDYYKIHLKVVQENKLSPKVIDLMINSVTCDLRNIWPDLNDKEFAELYDSKMILQNRI
ncbi:glycosyltransferase [Lentimicrobium sp. L6]|uniref:rhamnan synthesis F family protein n=1 Tax=Lentimicrobium sp. L6 TaxID=2735916 RepID=UPI0015562167|nr:rhamnan synthesis F family protein [Lentimicrobium sp. L6]NPD83640.1 glycosyltransferase [Lentimicrobium sp. L6]